jgi:hypothetical protein
LPQLADELTFRMPDGWVARRGGGAARRGARCAHAGTFLQRPRELRLAIALWPRAQPPHARASAGAWRQVSGVMVASTAGSLF